MDEKTWLSSNDPAAMLEYVTSTQFESLGQITGGTFKGASLQVGKNPAATSRKLLLYCAASANLSGKDDLTDAIEKLNPGNLDFMLKMAENWSILPQYASQRSAILRLIFGNPFRYPGCLAGTSCRNSQACKNGMCKCNQQRTPDVLSIAQACYDLRDPAYFGPLWDALEEAGCICEDICRALAWEQRCPHCKDYGFEDVPDDVGSPIPPVDDISRCRVCNGTGWLPIPGEPVMVRGFWPIDLILGKE